MLPSSASAASAPAAPPAGRTAAPSAGLVAGAVLALVVAALAAFEPRLFNDGDTGWHLATGRLILDSGRVPVVDPFSYSAAGRPWHAHEWLAELLMALAGRLGGWAGVALLPALALAAALALLAAEAARWLDARKTVLLLALVATVLMPFMLARPHVLAWPLLAGWTLAMLRAREAGRAPPLLLALAMLVWANLHASWALGLGIAALLGLEALIEGPDRRRVLIGWGSFGVLCLVAAMGTPQGPAGLLFPLTVSRLDILWLVAEWQPTSFPRHPGFEAVLLALLAVALLRPLRLPLLRTALLLGLLHLALTHERHQAVFAIVGALLLARPLGAALASTAQPVPRRWLLLPAVLLLALVTARLAVPSVRPDAYANPVRALAAVPADLRARPVFNAYQFGGSLILAGVRPYIDGRADMYGDAFVQSFWRLHQGDMVAFRAEVARRHIAWTMLARDAPLAAALDREPGWSRIYADRWAVVHVRRP